jgi:hypothetical protein
MNLCRSAGAQDDRHSDGGRPDQSTLVRLPVNNFSSGQLTAGGDGPLKMGGDYIRELNQSRGGEKFPTHACPAA